MKLTSDEIHTKSEFPTAYEDFVSLYRCASPHIHPMTDTRHVALPFFEFGLRRRTKLKYLLGKTIHYRMLPVRPSNFSAWIGWGNKKSGRNAARLAKRDGVACLLLETGFVSSIGRPHNGETFSLVADDLGIFYDASRPSRLEELIKLTLGDSELRRAQRLITQWANKSISKYNHAPDFASLLPDHTILVVDQVVGDESIVGGLASSDDFQRMLNDALSENPQSIIILKLHPDVICGRRSGFFDRLDGLPERVKILAEDVHPAKLIEQVEAVYVVTSQLGFEAVLRGKRVYTYGSPFYAGWGHTVERGIRIERRAQVPLENLVYASLISYARYIHPISLEDLQIEEVISWVEQSRLDAFTEREKAYAYQFSSWKKKILKDFFPFTDLIFVNRATCIPTNSKVFVWGNLGESKLKNTSNTFLRIQRIEDGFIRSVGFGSHFVRPLSWVADDVGIYYDATRPSRLEKILAEHELGSQLVIRAQKARERLIDLGITKYNVGRAKWTRPTDSVVLLVIGQVETDASLKYGAKEIKRNIDLLKRVREDHPNAYILYKPHPEVQEKLRDAGSDESLAADFADEIIGCVPLNVLLPEVDGVHVMTSQAGFEALMRRVPVVTYGEPFYAGWGLTNDRTISDAVRLRRSRTLTLDQLVAGALILYPMYYSDRHKSRCQVECVIEEINLKINSNQTRNSTIDLIKSKIFKKK